MTEETIFSSTDQVEPPVVEVKTNVIPAELEPLVGIGKKYATVEAALAAVPHQYSHINKIETENAALKEELTKRKTAQELIEDIKSGIPSNEPTGQKVEFNQDLVAQIVQQQLNQKEMETIAKSNMKAVATTFTEKFGADAEKVYNALAIEAGLPVTTLNQLAATSPTAVLKMAGLTGRQQPLVGKLTSDTNTQTSQSDNSGELSAKVGGKGSAKDIKVAWKIAEEKAKKELGLT